TPAHGEVDVVERGERTEGLDDLFHPDELVGSRHDGDLPAQENVKPGECYEGGTACYGPASTASANAAIEGKVQSGVTPAGGAGVAPQPGLSCRRLIHTVARPAALAGTWSWKRLWATCSSRPSLIPRRSASCLSASKLRGDGL